MTEIKEADILRAFEAMRRAVVNLAGRGKLTDMDITLLVGGMMEVLTIEKYRDLHLSLDRVEDDGYAAAAEYAESVQSEEIEPTDDE